MYFKWLCINVYDPTGLGEGCSLILIINFISTTTNRLESCVILADSIYFCDLFFYCQKNLKITVNVLEQKDVTLSLSLSFLCIYYTQCIDLIGLRIYKPFFPNPKKKSHENFSSISFKSNVVKSLKASFIYGILK